MINKAERLSAATIVMLGWSAMTVMAQDRGPGGHRHGNDAPAPAVTSTGQGRTTSPKGAEVYFHYALDGIRVPQRFTVQFGLRGMGVAPAGVVKSQTGHHHLLVDADNMFDKPIPSDYNHIHLGNGQTEVVLTLRQLRIRFNCFLGIMRI